MNRSGFAKNSRETHISKVFRRLGCSNTSTFAPRAARAAAARRCATRTAFVGRQYPTFSINSTRRPATSTVAGSPMGVSR